MLFRTHDSFELNIPVPGEFVDNPTSIRHWRAFEFAMNDFWFIVEFLTVAGEDSSEQRYSRTTCCTELAPVLELIDQEDVIEHRLNLVIPPHKTHNGQIQIKPLAAIFSRSDDLIFGTKEFITCDGERFIQPSLEEEDNNIRRPIYARPQNEGFFATKT